MWRIWLVQVVLERQSARVKAFTDMGAYDAACEYARDVRRRANNANKAVDVEIWELTEAVGVPVNRVAWKPRRR